MSFAIAIKLYISPAAIVIHTFRVLAVLYDLHLSFLVKKHSMVPNEWAILNMHDSFVINIEHEWSVYSI